MLSKRYRSYIHVFIMHLMVAQVGVAGTEWGWYREGVTGTGWGWYREGVAGIGGWGWYWEGVAGTGWGGWDCHIWQSRWDCYRGGAGIGKGGRE